LILAIAHTLILARAHTLILARAHTLILARALLVAKLRGGNSKGDHLIYEYRYAYTCSQTHMCMRRSVFSMKPRKYAQKYAYLDSQMHTNIYAGAFLGAKS
jgi:hypothetical protein